MWGIKFSSFCSSVRPFIGLFVRSFVVALRQKRKSEYDQEIPQSHTVDQPTAP